MAINYVSKAEGLPQEAQEQVGRLSAKMVILGFPAFFERLEEGPVVRTFFYKPSIGALFSKILSKEEELAGTLSVEAVMIERVSGLVAIAVPRSDRKLIRFDSCIHDMLNSEELRKDMALPLLMGLTPNGQHLYADLQVQPHLLLSGATGSGKSIFISQLVASLALFRSPKELTISLVDTKQLDLVLFKGLPHVRKIVTEVEDLRIMLERDLAEIRRRTELMSGLARNIKEWNALNGDEKLKYKIIIIDEFADVLAQDEALWAGIPKKDRPSSIASLVKQIAQISRAAGIHLICATQRPSVQVFSGDLKTNFPARICFKLPTMADSRVVLDENGAENLLGRGDYLYKIAGSDTLRRAHSAFMSMEDIAMVLSQHEEIRRQYSVEARVSPNAVVDQQ